MCIYRYRYMLFSVIFCRKICLLLLYFIAGSAPYNKMTTRILEECHETFVSCFHAFYPTAYLKWISLCDLLALVDKVSVYMFLKGII